jgi:hypothetical protein
MKSTSYRVAPRTQDYNLSRLRQNNLMHDLVGSAQAFFWISSKEAATSLAVSDNGVHLY